MKNRIAKYLLIGCVVFTCGCVSAERKQSVVYVDDRQNTIRVVNAERLRQGGNLLIAPFKAGPNVAATDELEKISLSMVQGLAEALNAGHSPFKILTSEDAGSADLVVKGYVTTLDQTSGVKKWLPGTKKIYLGLTGEIVDQKTEETIFRFSREEIASQRKENYRDMAYQVGQDIGQYILNEIHVN